MSSGAQVELGNNGENEDAVHTDRYITGMIGALIKGRNFLPLIVLGYRKGVKLKVENFYL